MALDMGSLMAGAVMPGEFEARLKEILTELCNPKEEGKQYLLFIDDLHTISGPNAAQGALTAFIPCCVSTNVVECMLFIDDPHAISGPNAAQGAS